jgi:hypothetical protein
MLDLMKKLSHFQKKYSNSRLAYSPNFRQCFSVEMYRCGSVLSGSMRMPLQLGAADPSTATTLCPMSDSNYSTFRSKRWRSNGHDGASTGTRGVSWHPEIVGSSGGRSNRVQTWIWSDIYDAEQKRVFVQAFPRIDMAYLILYRVLRLIFLYCQKEISVQTLKICGTSIISNLYFVLKKLTAQQEQSLYLCRVDMQKNTKEQLVCADIQTIRKVLKRNLLRSTDDEILRKNKTTKTYLMFCWLLQWHSQPCSLSRTESGNSGVNSGMSTQHGLEIQQGFLKSLCKCIELIEEVGLLFRSIVCSVCKCTT